MNACSTEWMWLLHLEKILDRNAGDEGRFYKLERMEKRKKGTGNVDR